MDLSKTDIARNLPYEICKYIDFLYAQLTNNKRKESFIKTTRGPWNTFYHQIKEHPLVISNNGHYFAHNFANNSQLICTQTNPIETINTGYTSPTHFSPNNTYCVIKDYDGPYLYNLINKNKYSLIEKEKNSCLGITISNNSQYVLLEGRHKIQQSKPIYFLWTLNEKGEPYKIGSENLLYPSFAAIFHPNNQYIIHNSRYDELRLYNIATTEDIIISDQRDDNVYLLDKLTITADNKTVLATTQPKEIDAQPDYILFNIENLDKVTALTLTPQSCYKNTELPVLSIPHKQMLTHITDQGHILQLVDHNQKQITKHRTTNGTHITALTVDTTGNYLAIGHSDGTIIIWNIFNSNPAHYEKTCIKSNDSIKSLTLTDNQLLLSQSTSTGTGDAACLWDVCGNKIMNFGNNIMNSIISPNGKTINIVCRPLQENPFNRHTVTLTTYYLTDEVLSLLNNKPNLGQLSRLINEKHPK
jgi:WD40 repeat protein